ncbi:MAG: phosphoenolpyruvate carboxylase, partial [Polyangiales bacterium]
MFDSTQRSRFDVADLEREANTLLTQYAALLQRLKLPDAAAALPLVGQARASVSDAQTLQALTVAFRLLDMAEARAVAQARAQARAHGAEESGLWASVLRELRLGKLPDAAIQAALGRVRVEAVFTAHPTEARRVSALQRWAELMQSLGEATSEAGPSSAFLPQLELILRMGETRLRKPRLDDERALVIHTVTTVLAPALMRVYRDASVQLEGALALAPADVPTPQFATWVGGDRDGHPFVTADFTQRSLQAYREAALTLQLQALGRLTQLLAIPAQLASLPAPFRARFAELCAALGPEAKSLQTRNPDEPLRVYVELLRAHLQQQVSDQNAATDRLVDTCLADLALLSAALRALGASALAAHYVEATRALWRAFGLHLLRVDLRQNSQVHDAAIEALLRRRGAADCD